MIGNEPHTAEPGNRALLWLAVSYPVLMLGSLLLKPSLSQPSALFPPIAVAFSAYSMLRRPLWPVIALLTTLCDLALILTVTAVTTGTRPDIGYALALSLSSSLIYIGMAFAVQSIRSGDRGGQPHALTAPSLAFALAAGALPGCLLSTWLHARAEHLPLGGFDLAIRIMSGVLSVISICPLIFGMVRGFDERILPATSRRELACIGSILALLCGLYYFAAWPLDRFLELMLLAAPLLWLALRCSDRAVAIVCALAAVGIGAASARGFGKFPPLQTLGSWRGGILSTQVFLLILCGEALLINRIILEERTLLEDSKRKEARLFAYRKALDEAEDSVRREAARDLHDGVAQIIAGQSMILSALRQRMAEGPMSGMVDQALAASREAQSAVRATIEDLSPPALGPLRPSEMLKWLAEHFLVRYKFAVQWRMTGDESLADGHERLIYRSIRELLFNALKHSTTDEARIILTFTLREIEIAVYDQGIGYAVSDQSRDGRVRRGLANLAEQVEIAGGRMQNESALGAGCRVTVRLPVIAASIPQS